MGRKCPAAPKNGRATPIGGRAPQTSTTSRLRLRAIAARTNDDPFDIFCARFRGKLTSREAVQVTAGVGVPVLCRRGLLQDALDALRRNIELNERDAAVECFAIMRDEPLTEVKAAHSFEQDQATGAFR